VAERVYSQYRRGVQRYMCIYISTHPGGPVPTLSLLSTYISRASLGPSMHRSPVVNPPGPTAATRENTPHGTPEAPDQAPPAPGRTTRSREAFLIFTKSARRGSADLKKWPTLYGKVSRARTTSIVNPVPGSIFPARERLHVVRPPNRGRRVCVKARDLSRLYFFPARQISFLVLVCVTP